MKTGDFFATSGEPRIEPFVKDRRPYALIDMVIWAVAILVPMLHYLIKLFFSGELLYFSIGAIIIITCEYKPTFGKIVFRFGLIKRQVILLLF